MTRTALEEAVAALAADLPPVEAEGLALARLGPFLALVPEGPGAPLGDIASRVVRGLDGFRAPPDAPEIARRRAAGLTPEQDALLLRWGYPYVMEAFRFHVTLTGPLEPMALSAVEEALGPVLAPILPRPFRLDSIALLREDAAGRFHLRERFPLGGPDP